MNTPVKEKTLAIIKPSAYKRRQTGAILTEIQAIGFRILELEQTTFSVAQAKEFYAEHAGRPYFDGLIEECTKGPCVAVVLEGVNAIAKWREIIGPTDPTLGNARDHARTRYGCRLPDNGLHGSDSPEAFEREYMITFAWFEAPGISFPTAPISGPVETPAGTTVAVEAAHALIDSLEFPAGVTAVVTSDAG